MSWFAPAGNREYSDGHRQPAIGRPFSFRWQRWREKGTVTGMAEDARKFTIREDYHPDGDLTTDADPVSFSCDHPAFHKADQMHPELKKHPEHNQCTRNVRH